MGKMTEMPQRKKSSCQASLYCNHEHNN